MLKLDTLFLRACKYIAFSSSLLQATGKESYNNNYYYNNNNNSINNNTLTIY